MRITRPDGTRDFDQVPLTEEDVLHPKIGDFIVQTDAHDEDRIYLKQVFRTQLEDEPAAVVIADHLVDWNIPGVRPLGPDIAVFFNVKRRDDWETFNVKAEGAKPALVVEVTSRATRKNDLGIKVDYYHRAKVPLYLIADAVGSGAKRRVTLIGRQYARNGYKLITPGEQGRIYLEPVRLWIGVTRDLVKGYERLACYDSETGEELGDYAAIVKDRNRARALAEEQSRARPGRAWSRRGRAWSAEAERGRAEAEARAGCEHLRRGRSPRPCRSRGAGPRARSGCSSRRPAKTVTSRSSTLGDTCERGGTQSPVSGRLRRPLAA